jgi:hypothetical protein
MTTFHNHQKTKPFKAILSHLKPFFAKINPIRAQINPKVAQASVLESNYEKTKRTQFPKFSPQKQGSLKKRTHFEPNSNPNRSATADLSSIALAKEESVRFPTVPTWLPTSGSFKKQNEPKSFYIICAISVICGFKLQNKPNLNIFLIFTRETIPT